MTPVAIAVKANLVSVTGSKHIYPATFANVGHNLVGQDQKSHTAKAVQVDSVGSFANRIEQELAVMGILPEITTQVGERLISIHELPHRAYDAVLRDSLLDGQPWRSSPIGRAVLGSTPDNATALYTYAPLTLLLGGWDSHGGDAGRGARIARSVACEIWGYEVLTARHLTQRIDPLAITLDSEPHALIDGILIRVAEGANGVRPSELGHGDVPGDAQKGVFVERIELTGAISLARLNRYHFPDDQGVVNDKRDVAARQALAKIALAGILAVMDKLDLRSGCELVTTSREILIVNADGSKTPLEVLNPKEGMQSAIAEAAAQGLAFSSPVRLVAGDALARLAQRGAI
jgi:CRISPR-associated protein Csb1